MNKFLVLTALLLLLFSSAEDLFSFDFPVFWRHPEIAEKNSVFLEAGFPFMFSSFEFDFLPVEIRADYMLPLPLPFSAGLFFKTPYPNFKSFGTRIAYHIDLRDPLTDVYVAYVTNLGFILAETLEYYNDTPAPFHFFDFRVGFRYFFGRLGLSAESGHKFESVIISLSVKLN